MLKLLHQHAVTAIFGCFKLTKNGFFIQYIHSTTILVWNELHLRSKDSGIWQSDKIDKHFSKYITLVIFFNYLLKKIDKHFLKTFCKNWQTLILLHNTCNFFKTFCKNRQTLNPLYNTCNFLKTFCIKRQTLNSLNNTWKFYKSLSTKVDKH